jgi:hypothetical protein
MLAYNRQRYNADCSHETQAQFEKQHYTAACTCLSNTHEIKYLLLQQATRHRWLKVTVTVVAVAQRLDVYVYVCVCS